MIAVGDFGACRNDRGISLASAINYIMTQTSRCTFTACRCRQTVNLSNNGLAARKGCLKMSSIFDDLYQVHGPKCFGRTNRMNRIINSLYRHIKASGNCRKVVKKVVGDAVCFHRRHSDQNGSDPHHACATHPVIVLAAHLCQKYQIVDEPELLQDIFMSVFLCDGGFDRFTSFLDPRISPFEVDPLIYPFLNLHTIDCTISDRHLEVLEYFLSQATRITAPAKLSEFHVMDSQHPSYTGYYGNVPFVEMPIFSSRGASSSPLLLACHSINAPAVLLLLRYGANPIGLYFEVRFLHALLYPHNVNMLLEDIRHYTNWTLMANMGRYFQFTRSRL